MDSRRFEQIKDKGRQHRRAGGKTTGNPYKLGTSTKEYDAWLLGFNAADRDAKAGKRR
jgi:membrane peptidoglycan carboxypeptidase